MDDPRRRPPRRLRSRAQSPSTAPPASPTCAELGCSRVAELVALARRETRGVLSTPRCRARRDCPRRAALGDPSIPPVVHAAPSCASWWRRVAACARVDAADVGPFYAMPHAGLCSTSAPPVASPRAASPAAKGVAWRHRPRVGVVDDRLRPAQRGRPRPARCLGDGRRAEVRRHAVVGSDARRRRSLGRPRRPPPAVRGRSLSRRRMRPPTRTRGLAAPCRPRARPRRAGGGDDANYAVLMWKATARPAAAPNDACLGRRQAVSAAHVGGRGGRGLHRVRRRRRCARRKCRPVAPAGAAAAWTLAPRRAPRRRRRANSARRVGGGAVKTRAGVAPDPPRGEQCRRRTVRVGNSLAGGEMVRETSRRRATCATQPEPSGRGRARPLRPDCIAAR